MEHLSLDTSSFDFDELDMQSFGVKLGCSFDFPSSDRVTVTDSNHWLTKVTAATGSNCNNHHTTSVDENNNKRWDGNSTTCHDMNDSGMESPLWNEAVLADWTGTCTFWEPENIDADTLHDDTFDSSFNFENDNLFTGIDTTENNVSMTIVATTAPTMGFTSEMMEPNIEYNDPIAIVSTERYLEVVHDPWDLSYYEHHDALAYQFTIRIRHLVNHFESNMPDLSHEMVSSYWTTQNYLKSRFHYILGTNCDVDSSTNEQNASYIQGDTIRVTLNKLYYEVIEKLNALLTESKAMTTVDMTTSADSPRRLSSDDSDGTISPSVLEFTPNIRQQQHNYVTPSVSKKDFVNYMTTWLRDNWTNPYNDDDGLAEMASTCGTSTDVISNWLINARTRKWRPALRKAVALNRPADLLLEDSLNIFDKKPIRGLSSTEIDKYYHAGNNHIQFESHLPSLVSSDGVVICNQPQRHDVNQRQPTKRQQEEQGYPQMQNQTKRVKPNQCSS